MPQLFKEVETSIEEKNNSLESRVEDASGRETFGMYLQMLNNDGSENEVANSQLLNSVRITGRESEDDLKEENLALKEQVEELAIDKRKL